MARVLAGQSADKLGEICAKRNAGGERLRSSNDVCNVGVAAKHVRLFVIRSLVPAVRAANEECPLLVSGILLYCTTLWFRFEPFRERAIHDSTAVNFRPRWDSSIEMASIDLLTSSS